MKVLLRLCNFHDFVPISDQLVIFIIIWHGLLSSTVKSLKGVKGTDEQLANCQKPTFETKQSLQWQQMLQQFFFIETNILVYHLNLFLDAFATLWKQVIYSSLLNGNRVHFVISIIFFYHVSAFLFLWGQNGGLHVDFLRSGEGLDSPKTHLAYTFWSVIANGNLSRNVQRQIF